MADGEQPQPGPSAEGLRRRARWALPAAALGLAAYVLCYPLAQVRYPPIIDLPFHAAQTSILAHYFDPAWHFREQFTIHPLESPYVSMYAIGALLSFLFPMHIAAKGMALVMLGLLPAGLGVLSWGMKKSPALGVLALVLAWNTLTHWGFLNFLGALGLMAMSIGFALRLLAEPKASYGVGLALSLIAVFFTHIYRLPFALLAVLGTGVVMYPATRRFKPLLAPMIPGLALFGVGLLLREDGAVASGSKFDFDVTRLADLRRHVFGAYAPPEGAPQTPLSSREVALSWQALGLVAGAGVLCAILQRRQSGEAPDDVPARWFTFVRYVPLFIAAGMLVAYVTLPLGIGNWFYVYPREAIAAGYFALGAFPDLPRRASLRWVPLALIAVASGRIAQFTATEYRRFEGLTADFREIVSKVPPAPKLFYLVYDLSGTMRRVPPFLHLPAWIQAEKGGWLNFHFVRWNHSLVRYRDPSDAVPPALPDRFEWTPQHFRMAAHGRWFDTFLVRHTVDPSALFSDDPRTHLVERRGTWWLYRREP